MSQNVTYFKLLVISFYNEEKKTTAALRVTNERINYLLTFTSVAIYTSKISGDYGAASITDIVKQMAPFHPGTDHHDHISLKVTLPGAFSLISEIFLRCLEIISASSD